MKVLCPGFLSDDFLYSFLFGNLSYFEFLQDMDTFQKLTCRLYLWSVSSPVHWLFQQHKIWLCAQERNVLFVSERTAVNMQIGNKNITQTKQVRLITCNFTVKSNLFCCPLCLFLKKHNEIELVFLI